MPTERQIPTRHSVEAVRERRVSEHDKVRRITGGGPVRRKGENLTTEVAQQERLKGLEWASNAPNAVADLADGIPTEFTLPQNMTVEEAIDFTYRLFLMHKASRAVHRRTGYAIGVTVRQAEARFDERYTQAFDPEKVSYGTLRNYSYLAGNVYPKVAEVDVSEKVLFAIAPIRDEAEQMGWALKAKANGWGGEKTRHEIKEAAEAEAKAKREAETLEVESEVVPPSREPENEEAGERRPRAVLYDVKLEGLLHHMREVARGYGYAVAIHGSTDRDLDLLAVPWVKDAAEPETLVEALRWECELVMQHDNALKREHGRVKYVLRGQKWRAGDGDQPIDLSVLAPRTAPDVVDVEEGDGSEATLDLVGNKEIASILGLDKQAASRLTHKPEFPAPDAVVGDRPIWRRATLDAYLQSINAYMGR